MCPELSSLGISRALILSCQLAFMYFNGLFMLRLHPEEQLFFDGVGKNKFYSKKLLDNLRSKN